MTDNQERNDAQASGSQSTHEAADQSQKRADDAKHNQGTTSPTSGGTSSQEDEERTGEGTGARAGEYS